MTSRLTLPPARWVQRILISSEFAQSELENTAKAMGAETRGGFKSAVAAMAGVAAAVINEGRTHPITKKLRDDYTALSLCAIGYELLHAAGNALGSPQVAALAQKRLHEVAGFIMALSQEIIPVSLQELAQTNSVDLTTAAASQKNVKEAWTS